jgi:hypothetical protein
MRRVILITLAAIGATASQSQAFDEPLVKDLRPQGNSSQLSVMICSRPGIPGHALVVLGKDDEQRQVCSIEAFGFYPASGGEGRFR